MSGVRSGPGLSRPPDPATALPPEIAGRPANGATCFEGDVVDAISPILSVILKASLLQPVCPIQQIGRDLHSSQQQRKAQRPNGGRWDWAGGPPKADCSRWRGSRASRSPETKEEEGRGGGKGSPILRFSEPGREKFLRLLAVSCELAVCCEAELHCSPYGNGLSRSGKQGRGRGVSTGRRSERRPVWRLPVAEIGTAPAGLCLLLLSPFSGTLPTPRPASRYGMVAGPMALTGQGLVPRGHPAAAAREPQRRSS